MENISLKRFAITQSALYLRELYCYESQASIGVARISFWRVLSKFFVYQSNVGYNYHDFYYFVDFISLYWFYLFVILSHIAAQQSSLRRKNNFLSPLRIVAKNSQGVSLCNFSMNFPGIGDFFLNYFCTVLLHSPRTPVPVFTKFLLGLPWKLIPGISSFNTFFPKVSSGFVISPEKFLYRIASNNLLKNSKF